MSSASASGRPHLIPATDHLRGALASIEQASLDFASPDPAQRSRGEATFLALRSSPGAVDYACFCLEHSQDAFVLFQSHSLILAALPSLPLANPTSSIASFDALLDFLLASALDRAEAEARRPGPWKAYVRSRAHQCIAAALKRIIGLELIGCVQAGADRATSLSVVQSRVQRVSQLISGMLDVQQAVSAPSRALTAIGICSAIVDEFGLQAATGVSTATSGSRRNGSSSSGKERAAEPGTPVGLSQLEHRWCKAAIQTHLLPILTPAVLQLLYTTSPNQAHAAAGQHLQSPLIALLERLLSWSFLLADPFAGLADNVNTDALLEADARSSSDDDDGNGIGSKLFVARPVPGDFADLLLGVDLVALIADSLSHRAGQNAVILDVDTHRLRQCFLLIASFVAERPDPAQTLRRSQTLRTTLQTLIGIQRAARSSASASRTASDLIFLSTALGMFASALRPSELCASCHVTDQDVGHLPAFVEALSTLTSLSFESALGPKQSSTSDADEEEEAAALKEECVEGVLVLWSSLCESVVREMREGGPSVLRVLWNALHGSLRAAVVEPYIKGRLEAAMREANADVEADDMSDVNENEAKDRDAYSEQLLSLAALARFDLEANLATLTAHAQPLIQTLSDVAHGRRAVQDPRQLEATWEATHWLALIVGHILADEPRGETPAIPDAVLTLGTAEDNPAVSLLTQFGLALLHDLSVADASLPASPQVTESLLWLNARWTASYLLVDEASGMPTSPGIAAKLSGASGESVLSYVLSLLRANLERWLSDADVLHQVAAGLGSCSRSRGILASLLGRPEFETVVGAVLGGLDALPASTHGPLIAGVVGCIYAGGSQVDRQREYFQRITSAIESRLEALLLRPDFAAIAQLSTSVAGVQNSLDMLEGLAQSAQPGGSARAVFAFISRFLPALVGLVNVYRQRQEVVVSIVRVFVTLTRSLDLGFSADEDRDIVRQLNAAVKALLDALSAAPEALVRPRDASALEEEVPFEGLSLAFALLDELRGAATNDEDEASALDPTLSAERTSDVCLAGLATLLPLVNDEALLSVPAVRRQLGSTTSTVVSAFPSRLVGVSLASNEERGRGLLDKAIAAIDLSLGADESSVALGALEAVPGLARGMVGVAAQAPAQAASIAHAAHRLLSDVLRSLLIEALDGSLVGAHLVACRSLLSTLSCEAMGGQATLSAALHEVKRSLPVRPRRRADASGSGASQISSGTEETGMRERLGVLLGEMANHVLSNAEAGTMRNGTTALEARTRAREEEQAALRFCEAVRPLAMRTRTALRVR